MSLVTIQRCQSPDDVVYSSTVHHDDSICNERESEDFFASKATAVLQNVKGRRHSSIIKAEDVMQCSLRNAVGLIRKEDSLILIVNLEKVNSKEEGYRYFCVILSSGKEDTEEYLILGVDFSSNKATIGFVLPICQDMSVSLDGDGGFKVINKDDEKLFKPSSVMALWSTVQLLNKACYIAHNHNYYVGGSSHTWVEYYTSKLSSSRAQIAEWNRMIDANPIENSSMAPKSAIGEFVIGTHVDQDIALKDDIRRYLKEIMRDQDLDEVTVVTLREKLLKYLSFDVKQYRSFITEEILIIYGQMDSASKILPHLYLGSIYNASNLEELSKNNVTHIINVSRESENFFREQFIYKNVQVFDIEKTNLLYHFNDCNKFINAARSQQSACLVHCQKGISRSATVVIAYLMKEFNWTLDNAILDVRSKRYCIRPNDSFLRQLNLYEGMLKASKSYLPNDSFQKRRNELCGNPQKIQMNTVQDDGLYSCYEYEDKPNSRPLSSGREDISHYNECINYITHRNKSTNKSKKVGTMSNIDIRADMLKYKAISILSDPPYNLPKVSYPNYKIRTSDLAKRLLRLKVDDSWIKITSSMVGEETNEVVEKLTENGELCDSVKEVSKVDTLMIDRDKYMDSKDCAVTENSH